MDVLTTKPLRQKKPLRWFWHGALLALLIWITTDVFVPRKHSIRQFDPAEVARLETVMWRSYYDKKPVLLFWQLAGGLRQQFHAPFWRSFGLASQATRAAFVFKQGQSRADYGRALPVLSDYYRSVQALSTEQFDVRRVAALELHWWIVHRQRNRCSYPDLAKALAQTSAALYNRPTPAFTTYAQLRADAMRLCDEAQPVRRRSGFAGQYPAGATEADWQRIERALNRAWANLHQTVRMGT